MLLQMGPLLHFGPVITLVPSTNPATKAVINSHESQQTRLKLRNVSLSLIASPALFRNVDQPKRKN